MKRPQRRSKPKPKTVIASLEDLTVAARQELARTARYCGSPYHKSRPADYGMEELPKPRPDKTRCDEERDFLQAEAIRLLTDGFKKGLVSRRTEGNWPQYVWAVDDEGVVYEARLTNREQGEYHGYPMRADDKFSEVVSREWRSRIP